MITGHKYFDDMQGILANSPQAGVTSYTQRQYRTTGIVYPHIAQANVFSLTLQLSHRKHLSSPIESVHIHYIPIASANGDIQINFSWGWYKHGDTIPDTLPNTGNKVITLSTTDQFKLKKSSIIENLTAPANEEYSSMLFVRMERVAPAGTNWGASNEIALVYVDAHIPIDRYGSYYGYTDTI